MNAQEIIERIMTMHWDFYACMCWVCEAGREQGLRPRETYLNWRKDYAYVKVEPRKSGAQ